MDHAALPTARSHWSNDSKAPGLARSDMSDSARCRRPMLHVSTAPTRYHVRVRTCAADQQTKACVPVRASSLLLPLPAGPIFPQASYLSRAKS